MTDRRPVYQSGGQLVEIPDGDVISALPLGNSDETAVGDGTFPRSFVPLMSAQVSTSGTLRLAFFTARKTETTTQVRVCTAGTAAGATPTLCRIGLYTVDASDNGTLVASVASDTTLWAAASTAYTRSWSSSYAKVAGQRYALGQIVVTAAAAPTWAGLSNISLTVGQVDADAKPRLSGALTGQTDLPGSFTSAALTSALARYYGVVLP